jgi:hypothetical protein
VASERSTSTASGRPSSTAHERPGCRPRTATRRAARRAGERPAELAQADGQPLLEARVDEQQRGQGRHLEQRQRGRHRQVEQLRGLAVDLDLERGEARAAEQQDHAERGEREQEDDRCRRGDGRPKQRQVTCRKACQRLAPSIRAASSSRGSSCAQTPPTMRSTTA